MDHSWRIVEVLREHQESLWLDRADYGPFFDDVGAPFPPDGHLNYLKNAGGELVVCTNDAREILGWMGLIPGDGEAELAGIGTHRDHRNQGVASALLERAHTLLEPRGIARLTFQTSPLLTANALLYVGHAGTRYTYHPGVFVGPDNDLPWPVVDCVMPLPARPAPGGLRWDLARPCVHWTGLEARFDPAVATAPAVSLPVPELSVQDILVHMDQGHTGYLAVVSQAFARLTEAGYSPVGFDRYAGGWAYLWESGTR